MIIVTGSVTARTDTFERLRDASLAHVLRSRSEDGCISHSVQVDCENPLRLFFYERWRDMAALQVHFEQPGSLTFVKAARELAESSEAVSLFEAQALPVPR